jgi:hypothetical protein
MVTSSCAILGQITSLNRTSTNTDNIVSQQMLFNKRSNINTQKAMGKSEPRQMMENEIVKMMTNSLFNKLDLQGLVLAPLLHVKRNVNEIAISNPSWSISTNAESPGLVLCVVVIPDLRLMTYDIDVACQSSLKKVLSNSKRMMEKQSARS